MQISSEPVKAEPSSPAKAAPSSPTKPSGGFAMLQSETVELKHEVAASDDEDDVPLVSVQPSLCCSHTTLEFSSVLTCCLMTSISFRHPRSEQFTVMMKLMMTTLHRLSKHC